MATPKPTIVLVPGAWHGPQAFQPLISALESAGYTCVGVKLPSVGSSPPLDGFEPDVAAIRSAIEAEIAADRDVVVLMHSYGSVPGGEAVKGLDKASIRKDRESGSSTTTTTTMTTTTTGGVTHLFYCAAFAPPKGGSLIKMLNDQPLPWFVLSEKETVVEPATPQTTFYNDVASAELTTRLVADLEPFSYRCFFSRTSWEPWRHVPATYLFCTDDQAIPIDAQRGMVEGGGGEKTWARLETIEGAGHSPFVVHPDRLAAMVRRAAGEDVVVV